MPKQSDFALIVELLVNVTYKFLDVVYYQ
uniref:Uncharacterized protein n=1 Tax=Arundo donax TaxID=35708 RepID=A0A0A9HF76_ARUDO